MKQNHQEWLNRGIAAVLAAGAVGLIAWQGFQYVKESERSEPVRRIQAVTTMQTESVTAEDAVQMTAASTSVASAQKKTTKHAETRTSAAASETSTVAFPLELNVASAEELEQLPGIGPVLAERIVSYRSQIGCFQNREQLLDVEGIGTATYAAIVDLLYLTEEYDFSDPAEPETEESQVVPEVPEAEPGNVPEESPQEPVTEAEMQPVDLNTASRAAEVLQIVKYLSVVLPCASSVNLRVDRLYVIEESISKPRYPLQNAAPDISAGVNIDTYALAMKPLRQSERELRLCQTLAAGQRHAAIPFREKRRVEHYLIEKPADCVPLSVPDCRADRAYIGAREASTTFFVINDRLSVK